MALNFNGNTPKKVNVNIKNSGIKHVAKVIFNNVVVWLEKVLTTITGYPITLTNSTGDDLVDYKVYGESQQGENLIDITNTHQFSASTGIDISNLVIGETYIFSSNTVFENVKISNKYNGYNSVFQNNTKEFTFKMARNENISSTDTQYLFLKIDGSWIADASLFANYDIQIKSSINIPTPDNPVEIESVGDKVTDESDENYGKYRIPIKINENITNIYLDEPLRKIGNYADYIDFENKKIVRNIKEITLTGNEDITKSTVNSNDVFIVASSVSSNITSNEKLKRLSLSNYFVYNQSIYVINKFYYTADGRLAIVYSTYGSTTLNSFTAILQNLYNNGIPVKVYYIVKTPTEETIELPTISTNKGTNIIEVDTNIKPSKMEVQYYAKEV